jgi:hypothetical protein
VHHIGFVHPKSFEGILEVVQLVRIASFRQYGTFIVEFKGFLDIFFGIVKIEDKSAVLVLVDTVESRERLYRIHSSEILIDIHRLEKRLIESRLELVGADENLIISILELVRDFAGAERIEIRFVPIGPVEIHIS